MKTKNRNPWLAAMLAFFCVPVGYVYAGYFKIGLIISSIILLLIPALAIFVKINLNIFIIVSFLLIILFFSLTVIANVYKLAKRQPLEYKLKLYNKWWIYIIIYIIYTFVLLPVVQNYTKENLIQAYKIPAGSMLPTLEIGDHIFVDKWIYKNTEIGRGDLIVFPFPKKPTTEYIKRVVGLQGDEIEIANKVIFLNNKELTIPSISHSDPNTLPVDKSPRDNFGPIVVPNNCVFVLGDNMDNSYDSRFWGFVPIDSIKGKVVNIYWSWDKANKKARWNRIGLNLL